MAVVLYTPRLALSINVGDEIAIFLNEPRPAHENVVPSPDFFVSFSEI